MMIKEPNRNDVDTVYQFVNLLENTTFDYLTFKKIYIDLLDLEHHFMYLAYVEDKAVGFAHIETRYQLHHCAKTSELIELVVDESYRSQGIGQALFDHIVSKAKEEGCVQLELSSSLWRTRAHQFYERKGMNKDHYNFTYKL